MAFAQFEIEFRKDGQIHEEAKVARLLDAAAQLDDLLVLSHGWNNDKHEAGKLYDGLCGSVSKVLDTGLLPELVQRRFGVMRIFWPSKRFADEDLVPGGGAASATRQGDDALMRILQELERDPELLGGTQTSAARSAAVAAAQRLVPKLETDPVARREFVLNLRSLLDPAAADPDDASEEFFVADPEKLFQKLGAPVSDVPVGPRDSSATSMSGAGDAGGAAGLGDMLSGIKAAARRIANFTTYYEMKQRAGTVGRTGVAQVLRRLRERNPELRLHLAGHSFGGRLVTAAAHALPDNTPAVTLTLLQAAFSHNGLAKQYDNEHDGAFRALVSAKRASGPILITHTKNDRAVGIAYPLASRIARDQASSIGTRSDPYGGMGRNGAQHTPEAENLDGDLLETGGAYAFAPGRVYNLKADAFIKDHGDVEGVQVAWAVLCAAQVV